MAREPQAENLEGSNMESEEVTVEEEPEAEKIDWEEPSLEQLEGEEDDLSQGGVQVGLSPLGPVIIVTQADGSQAQKLISIEECFLLAGQLTAFASFLMGINIQQQMAQQAQLQAMMQQGEERTASGLYVKKS